MHINIAVYKNKYCDAHVLFTDTFYPYQDLILFYIYKYVLYKHAIIIDMLIHFISQEHNYVNI